MKLGILAAVDQRIALRYTMPPMTDQETGCHLRHRLNLAGRSDTLFSDDATAPDPPSSRGYPRAVNNLAVQSLIAAFAVDKTIVDEPSTRAAVAEVTAVRTSPRHLEHQDPARHPPGAGSSHTITYSSLRMPRCTPWRPGRWVGRLFQIRGSPMLPLR